jgi:hypothetical protein
MAFMNLGGFMSTYYIAMLAGINSAVRFPIFVAMCLYGISGIVYALTPGQESTFYFRKIVNLSYSLVKFQNT